MELIDKLDTATAARREANAALKPLLEKLLGQSTEDAHRNMRSWTHTWDDQRRVLTITLYSQGGIMDSVTSRDKEYTFTEEQLRGEPVVGGSFT